eukprot:346403_1
MFSRHFSDAVASGNVVPLAFAGLCVVLMMVQGFFGEKKTAQEVTTSFKSFQRHYLVVYLIMMCADWLQGPYVYALYAHYGFSEGDIGKLFSVGFATSMVFGVFIGAAADKFGRKKMCLVYAATYALGCFTKHSKSFQILLIGRFCGGVATSILFSAFESWMVHAHRSGNHNDEWLSQTFSLGSTGNGVVAIIAGVIASGLSNKFGPVAPFDFSAFLLIIGFIVIFYKWEENYGDQSSAMSETIRLALDRLKNDPRVWLLGLIQSTFEGAMYIFVFKWTPALEFTLPGQKGLPHGWIFACFMAAVMIGSITFGWLVRSGYQVERFMMYVFVLGSVSLLLPIWYPLEFHVVFAGFLIFEFCVGMFWPGLGTMRGKYVPENVRATVMNFFRVPLNMFVVGFLFYVDKFTHQFMFFCCACLITVALICQIRMADLTCDSTEAKVMQKQAAEMPSQSEAEKKALLSETKV